jgi:hypothetical protein
MNRVFGRKKAPGPPPPSLGEASAGVGGRLDSIDGEIFFHISSMLFIDVLSSSLINPITHVFNFCTRKLTTPQRQQDSQNNTTRQGTKSLP